MSKKGGTISYNGPRLRTLDSIDAIIKHYGRNHYDSLFITNKTVSLAVQIPFSNKTNFLIAGKSKIGVFLQSKDRTKELTFRIRDTSWSTLKIREFKKQRSTLSLLLH